MAATLTGKLFYLCLHAGLFKTREVIRVVFFLETHRPTYFRHTVIFIAYTCRPVHVRTYVSSSNRISFSREDNASHID